MTRSESDGEKAVPERLPSASVAQAKPPDDPPTSESCIEGFVDITELLWKGVATWPTGLTVGGEDGFLENCFLATELPVPLEDKTLWLETHQHEQRVDGSKGVVAASTACTAARPGQGPSPTSKGGIAEDGSSLLHYLRLQQAAAAGVVPLRAQIAVMQRLLLMLLPLLQGSSGPRTFLRCLFFKRPFAPILQASVEGSGGPLKEDMALVFTSHLPILRHFCAVYVRLCIRMHTLNCFGTHEQFIFEEDSDFCNNFRPWSGLLHLGWQGEMNTQTRYNGETLQQFTDRVERINAESAQDLWALDDTCVKELLDWGPPQGRPPRQESPGRAPKTRQDCILERLVVEAEALEGDAEEKEAALKCCRFLRSLVVLVEGGIVLSGLATEAGSPYSFQPFVGENSSAEVPEPQKGAPLRGQSHRLLERGRQAPVLQAVSSCLSELLELLRSRVWLESLLRPESHPQHNADAKRGTGGRRHETAEFAASAHAPVFDVELCFKPLILHYQEPIEMTATPVPSISSFCKTMASFLQLFWRFVSGSWQRGAASPDVPIHSESIFVHEMLPRWLMEDIFHCFSEQEQHQLRAVTWDLTPPLFPPFPKEEQPGEREGMQTETGSVPASRAEPLADVSEKEVSVETLMEPLEVPTGFLRVLSYGLVTRTTEGNENAWLVGRLKAFRPQGGDHLPPSVAKISPPLERAFACIGRGCACKNCESWRRWKSTFRAFVLIMYSALHQPVYRQLAHVQGLQKGPQEFVEETVLLVEAKQGIVTPGLKCNWRSDGFLPRMKAHAFAVAFDALLLQQQHALALTVRLQLTQPIEDIVVYWSLLNVILSSEQVRNWQLSDASEDPKDIKAPLGVCQSQVALALLVCSRFLLAVASHFNSHDKVKNLRTILWPFYCVRCAPLYLAIQPLMGVRTRMEEVPPWACDEMPAAASSEQTKPTDVAFDCTSVSKLAHISANMMHRFSFEGLCESVESICAAPQNASASAELASKAALAWLSQHGEMKAGTALDQAMMNMLQETVSKMQQLKIS